MKKTYKNILKYLLELLIVAFGVFLGFMVSEWNDDRKTQKQLDRALEFVYEEMGNNCKTLINAIEYHEKIKHGLDSMIHELPENSLDSIYIDNSLFDFNEIPGWKGVRTAGLDNTGFTSLQLSGLLQEMDIREVQTLSKAYKYLDFYSDFSQTPLERLVGMNSTSKVIDVIGALQLLTGDVLGTEKNLKGLLEKTLKELKTDTQ